jgi:hypothetical protein
MGQIGQFSTSNGSLEKKAPYSFIICVPHQKQNNYFIGKN